LSAAVYDPAWRAAIILAAAVAAFVLCLYLLRPKDKPVRRYVLVAAVLYLPTVAADFLPLIWVLFRANPDASLPATICVYAAVVAAAAFAARKGYGRSVFAAASALPIRWVLSVLFADILSKSVG
jgi:hypothetical protein